MKSLPLTMIDELYSSTYLMFEDGRILNTNSGKYLTMDVHNRVSLNHAGYTKPVHRSVRKLYKALFGRAYHGIDTTIDLPNERWLEVIDSNGDYYISSYGRIKSYAKHANPRILTPYIKDKSRPYLFIDIHSTTYAVHRLVAKHFLSESYSEEKEVHHKDGNTMNNSVDNLECLTKEEHLKIHYRTKQEALNNVE